MAEKFGRRFELTIYPAQYLKSSADGKSFSFTTTDADPIQITNPFTFNFNVRRAALSSANIGTFSILNLGQTTRNQLYKDKTNRLQMRRMTLRAGYTDPLPLIFDGNIKWCTSCRPQGSTNFVTEIEAFDWNFPMVNSHTTKSFPGEVKKNDIVNQLVGDVCAMGPGDQHPTPGYIHKYADDKGDPLKQYNRSLSGYSWDLLKEETDNACFIDNGKLHILPDDFCFTGGLTEISSATGLLGAPKRSETYVIAEMLFEPTLAVGQKVTLNTESQKMFNGDYKIFALNHLGVISDAVGGRCQTTVSLFSFKKNAQLINQIGIQL